MAFKNNFTLTGEFNGLPMEEQNSLGRNHPND